jgi:predicted DNA-binding protein with PD1-like motif
MRYFGQDGPLRVYLLSLEPGDYLLESIEEFIAMEGITHGAVVSGIGALDQATLHMVTTTTFPPEESYPRWGSKPFELACLQGAIIDGVPHIHTMLGSHEYPVGGHLEHRCRVLYLAEIVVLSFAEMKVRRVISDRGVSTIVGADG